MHQTSVAFLAGISFHSFLRKSNDLGIDAQLFTYAGIIAAISGLWNAHAAQPSRMAGKANVYRGLIYGVKMILFLGLTPLINLVVTANDVPFYRGVMCLCAISTASFAKFYREENTVLPKRS
eukprot:TRINITY_DN1202_c0_g1_i1.p2 TRINITY_DN1202_c0_g1~~TRINITY_DN1202_c0_g1_i1.p2  ORF type:complete len:130 (+),score=23.67 TRINITY_DN1202_c0_g1_i1:26-391(+)